MSDATEPCICNTGPSTDGPDETCPHHGRPYAYWVEYGDRWNARAEAAEKEHRDLTGRLGFGDNITEPMASNDEIVRFLDAQFSEANEWVESQRWRDDCYAAGHPDDEDCYEHDPARRLEAAEAALAHLESTAAMQAAALARVEALADRYDVHAPPINVYSTEIARDFRAALNGDDDA